MSRTSRTTAIRPVGDYLQGLNYDPRQAIGNLEKVIGRLPDQHDYNYTGHQARTFGDLTELLLKRAPRIIKAQVTGLLQKSYVSPYTTYLLPIRQFQDHEGLSVTWSEINFNPGFVDQVETLGLGRYFTHNKTKRGARAVRRGAAVKIEAGFFMTAEGREEWAMQIAQLATAIQETNEYDVLITLLQTPHRQEIHAQDMNGPYNNMFYGARPDMTFSERLTLMKDMFSIVNKTPDSRGFNGMVTSLKTIMEKNGTGADCIVVPPHMVGFFHYTKDDLWQHQSAGPAVTRNRETAGDIGGDGPFRSQTIQNLRIVDTHVYRPVKGARSSANDLLTVPTQIGEFYPMCIDMVYRDNRSFGEYRSSDRDIEIFNEFQSRFVPIYFLDALEHTFRFKDDSPGSLSELHSPDGNNSGTMNDMFTFSGGAGALAATCQTWGDVSSEFLSDDSLLRMANSVQGNLFNEIQWKEFGDALRDRQDPAPLVADGAMAIVRESMDTINTCFHLKEPEITTLENFYFQNTTGLGSKVNPNNDARDEIVFRSGTNKATQMVVAMFLHSELNLSNFKSMHDGNVFLPVDIILARPWMTYNASSVILMRAGRETGETLIGRQDFQMSSNTQTREIEASMVYYGKAVVTNGRNVMVAPNVFIQNYISGNNVDWVTDNNLAEIQEFSGLMDAEESLISMLVPAGCRVQNESWIDYRGINPDTGDKKYHASSEFYAKVFMTTEDDIYTPTETFIDYEEQSCPVNSICWGGHINYGKNFKLRSDCQGHLGPRTYDQVNNSRKEGQYTPIQSLHFNVTRGH
jgi:hypothetical protein